MNPMKRNIALTLVATALAASSICAFGLSLRLPEPQILFPQGYNTNRANQVLSVLRSDKFKYLGGQTPTSSTHWSTPDKATHPASVWGSKRSVR